ncbi:hypothetical protein [Larkinella soli]|uniref:hypothetical protein n=1 Tax=Larkinella soli TaxID=1770527 RepID=UPI001E6280F6|nr:hypothetical protein [Larkinella soli]
MRQLPFTVPEGYFDALPSRIQAETVRRSGRFTISWSWPRTVATLGGATLVAALLWLTYPQKQNSLGPDVLSEVSEESVRDYLYDQDIYLEDYSDLLKDHAVPNDSTLIHELHVSPEAIEQAIEEDQLGRGAI